MIVPLRYQLRNGDTVEIITTPNQKPNKDWLKFVVTSRAKTKIRCCSAASSASAAGSSGRDLLDAELRKHETTSLRDAPKRGAARDGGRAQLRVGTVDELIVAVGYGKITPSRWSRRCCPSSRAKERRDAEPPARARRRSAARSRGRKRSIGGIKVAGEDDILVRSPSAAPRCRAIRSSASSRAAAASPCTARLRQGARPGSRAPHRRRVGRRVQDAAPGRDPGPLRRQAGPARAHLPVVHRSGRQHLAGALPRDRGRPRGQHVPGHGRRPRSAQDRDARLQKIDGVVAATRSSRRCLT